MTNLRGIWVAKHSYKRLPCKTIPTLVALHKPAYEVPVLAGDDAGGQGGSKVSPVRASGHQGVCNINDRARFRPCNASQQIPADTD